MRRKLHRDKSRRNIYVRSALAVTAAAVVLILLHAITVSSWDSLASAMEASKFGFALWRLSLFLLLIGGWPVFTDKYADWVGLTAEETASLKAYRWRMADGGVAVGDGGSVLPNAVAGFCADPG